MMRTIICTIAFLSCAKAASVNKEGALTPELADEGAADTTKLLGAWGHFHRPHGHNPHWHRPHSHNPHYHVPVSAPHAHVPANTCKDQSGSADKTCTNTGYALESSALLATPDANSSAAVDKDSDAGENTDALIDPQFKPYSKEMLVQYGIDADEVMLPDRNYTEVFLEAGCSYTVTLRLSVYAKIKGCYCCNGELYTRWTMSVTISGQCSRRITYKKAKRALLYQGQVSKVQNKGSYRVDLYAGIRGSVTVTFSGDATAKSNGRGSGNIHTPTITKHLSAHTWIQAQSMVSVEGLVSPAGVTVAKLGVYGQAKSRGWIYMSTSGNSVGAYAYAVIYVRGSTTGLSLSFPSFNLCGNDIGFSLSIPSFGLQYTVYSRNLGLLADAQPRLNSKTQSALAELRARCGGNCTEDALPEWATDPYEHDEDRLLPISILDQEKPGFDVAAFEKTVAQLAAAGKEKYPEYDDGSIGTSDEEEAHAKGEEENEN